MPRQLIRKALKKLFFPYYFGREIYRCESPYNRIRVVDKGSHRFLIFDDPSFAGKYPEEIFQGCLFLKDPRETVCPYADYFHFAFALRPAVKSVFMVGLGSGLVPLQFLNRYPLEEFHVAEIDGRVADVAARYFALPRDMRLRVFVREGRSFLEECRRTYDLILLDAFFARSLPFPLVTRQFFRLVKERLSEEGLLAINVNGALAGGGSPLLHALYRTLESEFPGLIYFAHRPAKPEEVQNIVLFAAREAGLPTRAENLQKARGLQDVSGSLAHLVCRRLPVGEGPLLDDALGLKTLDLYEFALKH